MTDFARRVKMRALIEGPADHDWEIGDEIDYVQWANIEDEVLGRVFVQEAEEIDCPLAATAVARHDLELVLDEAAVISKFPQEEK